MQAPVPAPHSPTRRAGERGFILAMVLAMTVIMGLMCTQIIPPYYTEVRRDMEAELIFRGEAMAKAIRVYQMRTGTYPTSLDALLKLRPRILRRIYKDPMTKEGDWDLITAVQPGPSGVVEGLPIVGVRSKSQKDSFKVYRGKTLYSEWAFTATDSLLGIPGRSTQVPPLQSGVPAGRGDKPGSEGSRPTGEGDKTPPSEPPKT